MTLSLPTILDLARDLAEGRRSSRDLVEEALARIADPSGEGARSFLKVWGESALRAADAQDGLRRAGYVVSPLAGLPVSVKDLFDVAGELTLAGSTVRADAAPAGKDATVVARLRAAGAVLIGRTNMTEFAFSGVGINPHYGTPGNPFDRSSIPGGSSSGAAVAVADGCGILAIGSDTGGSVRVPAALCGLVGFKPTQSRVPRDGVLPLSKTLDSIGPLARSVSCCAIADAVLAGEPATVPAAVPVAGLRLGVPQTFVLDDLDHAVAHGFERACQVLASAGARIAALPLAEFADYAEINRGGGFASPEAFSVHAETLDRRGDAFDQRVRVRMERGRSATATDYIRLVERRADFIARVDAATADFDALIWPTVPVVAPPIESFAADDAYWRLNALLLRNTAIVNFLDRCAITVPVVAPGLLPVGLMVVGVDGQDRRLLAMALGIEAALDDDRKA